MASNDKLELTTIINVALRGNSTIVSLVGFAKTSKGVDTANPAIYNTMDMSRIQTNFPCINFFISGPYGGLEENIRTISATINCRSQSKNGDYTNSDLLAFEVQETLNRQFKGNISGTKYFFKIPSIETVIVEPDNAYNTPVIANIVKIK